MAELSRVLGLGLAPLEVSQADSGHLLLFTFKESREEVVPECRGPANDHDFKALPSPAAFPYNQVRTGGR